MGRSVFLAGSIDMGKAANWQRELTTYLAGMEVTVLNPRRDDFDPTLEQSVNEPKFVEQVEWELRALEKADVIAMYFDPKGQAPITLAELGIHCRSKKLVVCCPDGFWRQGNVEIICRKYRIPFTKSFETFAQTVKAKILFG